MVAKPVAARGFMSGRGPLADVAKDKLVCPAARQTVGGTKRTKGFATNTFRSGLGNESGI